MAATATLASARSIFAAQSAPGASPLVVTITSSSTAIREPFPLPITLHFHNAGHRTLWLYRPVHPAGGNYQTTGGSTISIHLEPATPQAAGAPTPLPATGNAFRVPGFPHPELMPLAPGADAEENTVISIAPAKSTGPGGGKPIWGAYRLLVEYGAHYSNGDAIRQAVGVDLWSGSVQSNPLAFTLEPASAADAGMVYGKVINRRGLTLEGVLVSLTDNSNRLLGQSITGPGGGFQFVHLPFGIYWVTVRELGADEDNSFFEHADLSSAQPDSSMKMMMLNQEVYEAKRLLHKPVIFRVENGAGTPQPGIQLKILWSNGPILENVKAETNQSGLAVVNLLPGNNFVTVTRRHCPKIDRVANVSSGAAIDGDSITFNCEKR